MNEQNTNFETLLKFQNEMFERIPFNKVLKLKIMSLGDDEVSLRFDMRDELIGNYIHGILHGGVISSTLDVAGGVLVTAGVLKKMAGRPIEEIKQKVYKIGTVDLRIDFLRPGRGKYFLATGSIMRIGNKVVVTRTSLHNDQDLLIAVGTGTYMLG